MKITTMKFGAAKRTEVKEPISRKIWIRNAFSELIGTFVLAMFLAGASIIVEPTKSLDIADYMVNPVIVGLYAGFIGVGAVLMIFLRWSCDLNPAVTTYRMIIGTETVRYGLFKMVFQFLGGILAGLLIYAIGKAADHVAANKAWNAYVAIQKVFKETSAATDNVALGGLWVFFVEILITIVLLYAVFSKTISQKYRHISIVFIISMSVWAGILGGSAAINPARGFAQQVPAHFFGAAVGGAQEMSHVTASTIGLIAGGYLAPFAYALLQDFNEQYFTPAFDKIIEYKNNNMKLLRPISETGKNKKSKKR